MRKMLISLLALVVLLAGCTAGGGPEATMTDDPTRIDSAPALHPVTPDSEETADTPESYSTPGAYPEPEALANDAYPAAPAGADLPAGYPDLIVVPPSDPVDLGQLTPVPGDPTPQIAPAPGRPGQPADPQISRLLEGVVSNLSGYADVGTDEVEVISVEPVTWPNPALGCPVEGLNYAEVQVEGSLVTLRSGDEVYTYHTAGSGEFVLCRDGERLSEGVVLNGG